MLNSLIKTRVCQSEVSQAGGTSSQEGEEEEDEEEHFVR